MSGVGLVLLGVAWSAWLVSLPYTDCSCRKGARCAACIERDGLTSERRRNGEAVESHKEKGSS